MNFKLNGGLLIVGIFLIVIGYMGSTKVENLKENKCEANGTTIEVMYPAEGSPEVRFEFNIDGILYKGSNSFYPLSRSELKVPGGIYKVYYECANPENCMMDFYSK